MPKAMIKKFANNLIKQYHIKTIEKTNEVLVYENGVYVEGGENLIGKLLEEKWDTILTVEFNEIINKIKRKTKTKRDEFDKNPYIINVKNGLINLETGEFYKHTPKYLSRIQIPIHYDRTKRPKKFLKFLMDCLPDPVDRTTAVEQFASTLIPIKLEKMYLHQGEGSNGKSTYCDVINYFHGDKNVSNISLQDLVNNKFYRAELEGKLVNTYADISSKELKDTALLKSLISGDPVTADKKNKNPFKFRNRARLFFSANNLPEIKETTDAMLRRLIILNWDTKFKNNPTIQERKEGIKQINIHLLEELTTEDEISGILNLLIFTARRLLKNKKFTFEQSISQIRSEWFLGINSVRRFLTGCISKKSLGVESKIQVKRAYLSWCEINDEIPKSTTVLNRVIKNTLGAESSVERLEGIPTKVWKGIVLNLEEPIVKECN